MIGLKRCLAVFSVVCAAAVGGADAYSQTAVAPPAGDGTVGGLWRDLDGRLWCGGTCGVGQQCCTITIHR
jgi:hypothetical protein